jgi:zinc protease
MRFLAFALLLVTTAFGATPVSPSVLLFPPASGTTDLAPDPALIVGELSNGLRYTIRANPEPRARAALRLVVAAGSFHETEAQRGLAHFLEHMAFNGSTHYAPGTLIEFFQRMGMNFGGDTNAYTSFDRTVYMLELPDTRPETLAEGCRVLADFAGHLLLLPEEISRERGVVLSEKLARDSADYRAAIAGYDFFYSGTILPTRLPIGLEPVIKSAERPAFADFYDTWYRPERLAVIAVGDLDTAVAEKAIRENFTALVARGPARPSPELGTPLADPAPRFTVHAELDASACSVTLTSLRAPDLTPDTAGKRLRELPRDLAFAILNRRFTELAKTDTAPFVRAASGPETFPALFDGSTLRLTARPGQWRETLRVGENELRRALLHGFLAAELREVIAATRNALDQAVKTDSTRRSEDRADELVDAYIEGTVPTAPSADLALLGPALDHITLTEVNAALVAAWASPAGPAIAVIGKLDPAPSVAELTEAYGAATQIAVAPPTEHADAAWAYNDFGPAGTVAKRTEIADLGLTEITFANGVRLNLKRTDFEAGTVGLRARVGIGQLDEPRDRPGLSYFAGAAFTAGGLGTHSSDELRRILAGRNVGIGLQVADDALIFSGATTPADLALQLELLTATLTDPGYRAEAQLLARRQFEPLYNRLVTEPVGVLRLASSRLLAGGDTRLGIPARGDVQARNLDELRAWLAPKLATGAIELSLVGDFEPEVAIAAVARTVGALPERGPRPALDELRRISLFGPGEEALTFASNIEKNHLAVYWPTTDGKDIRITRRLTLLANILGDRLRKTVREEIGGSYSPSANSSTSDTYSGFGFIAAQIATDPADLPKVREAVLSAASDLAAHGVTEEELTRARTPILTALRESERNNAYWLSAVLAAAQEQPWRLDWARSRYADHEAITKAELDALAAAYLSPERALKVTVRPAAANTP